MDIILQIVFLAIECLSFVLHVKIINNANKQDTHTARYYTVLKVIATICNIIRITLYRPGLENILKQYLILASRTLPAFVNFMKEGGLQYILSNFIKR